MRRHLSDAELVDAVAGDPGTRIRDNRVECQGCRADLGRLRSAIATLASELDTVAARPDAFWDRQRVCILGRIRQPPRRLVTASWGSRVPVTAAGAALLLGAIWWGSDTTGRAGKADTDPALLPAVQHAIDADTPSALRPVALLVAEIEGTSAGPPHEDGGQR
jgi:hypothetical protein